MDFNGLLQGIKNAILPQQKIVSPLPEGYNPQNEEAYSRIRSERPAYKGDYNAMNSILAKYPVDELLGGSPAPTAPPAKPKMMIQKRPAQVLGSKTTNPVTEEQIRKGWEQYGNPPAATASATFAEVANQYPALRENPGLLPGIMIKESSGGKAKTKNWGNWALYNDDYQESDPNQVIRDMAEAIAGENSNSSHYYQKFRETRDVRDMLDRYAPPTENDTDLYHKQLLDWIEMFR